VLFVGHRSTACPYSLSSDPEVATSAPAFVVIIRCDITAPA
jgi:hypothetical protein